MQTQQVSRPQQKTYSFGASHNDSPAYAGESARQAGNGPIKSFRSGSINVAIWENETLGENNIPRSYKTVSLERGYKDKKGEWKNTNQLRVNDLPKAALLLSKAYEYLVLTGASDEPTPEELLY